MRKLTTEQFIKKCHNRLYKRNDCNIIKRGVNNESTRLKNKVTKSS